MPPGRPIALSRDHSDGFGALVRAGISIARAGLDKSRPGDVARAAYGDDRGVDLVLRAAVSPAALANSPALARIVVATLDALVPASAGVALLRRSVQLNFAGAAQINVPGVAVPNATFIAEGQPIPVRQTPTSAGPALTPNKLMTIVALSRELVESSNAETLVEQVLVESLGPGLDAVLLSASAATTSQPAGLLNGIAALAPAGAGEKAQVLVDDLQALATAVAPVAGNGDVTLIAAPAQAVALRLRLPSAVTWPVLASASLAAGTVIMVAGAAVASAVESAPVLDTVKEATLHFDATVPGEIVTIGGVVARPVGSLFQTDNIGLRVRWPITWGVRDARGIAYMTGVNW
jgi:Phage capsid family